MTGRFVPRPIRPNGITEINGWRLKHYEITLDGSPISKQIAAAVNTTLNRALPPAAGDVQVGFVIIHHGAEQIWALADLWRCDIVYQHTFYADLNQPTEFAPVQPGGPTACVWELTVHAHERDAFVKHILNPLDGPHVDHYLADTIAVGTPTPNE